MKKRPFLVRAIIAVVVAMGVLGGTAGAAQAKPKECRVYAQAMRLWADRAHEERVNGNFDGWSFYNDLYVDAWYASQDAGC
ncbi:hypothetical protein [Microbispora sp. NPDC046933]|uniref:hypothetical protein n=1 Tax=Microbispora sp. NPDC046933 TaxID=3155618 RepID=UPI0033FC9406